MSWLLDTNILSELTKARPNRHVTAWFDSVDSGDLHLSVISLGEIARGIELVRPRDGTKAERLESWLTLLPREFGDRIIPLDAPIADRWGRLSADRKLPVVDALLAATAFVRGLTLVTRNVRDISRLQVSYLNPFVPEPAP